jgi:hypothetical protein
MCLETAFPTGHPAGQLVMLQANTVVGKSERAYGDLVYPYDYQNFHHLT